MWKWWEEEPHPEGVKWLTLEHNVGVVTSIFGIEVYFYRVHTLLLLTNVCRVMSIFIMMVWNLVTSVIIYPSSYHFIYPFNPQASQWNCQSWQKRLQHFLPKCWIMITLKKRFFVTISLLTGGRYCTQLSLYM